MAGRSTSTSNERRSARILAESFTDDILVEILSRVPYKSLCRFKCVSRRWRRVVSDPDHRRALPRYHLQGLAGFFYTSHDGHRYFGNASGRGRPFVSPALSFMPQCESLRILDSCNGLLLCSCWKPGDSQEFNYVVCNPATERFCVLPESVWTSKMQTVCLGFDPAVSSHFHVFEFVEDFVSDGEEDGHADGGDGHVEGVKVYSSETGVWIHKENGWGFELGIRHGLNTVFFNGMLHLVTLDAVVAAVDVEGEIWRTIPKPREENYHFYDVDEGCIDLLQGCLCFLNTDNCDGKTISVWVLDDYNSEGWILKHSVKNKHLFGRSNVGCNIHYKVVAIDQERNMIFIVFGKTLISYEMDSKRVSFIPEFGHNYDMRYLPYFPLFSDLLADG